jgi:hypothetical protein
VDCAGCFDTHRLCTMLHGALRAAGLPQGSVESAVHASLQRLRIMACRTSGELDLGLSALRCELAGPEGAATHAPAGLPGTPGGSGAAAPARPRLLLIDGVSSFQWLQRAEHRFGQDATPSSDSMEARLSLLVGCLRRQRLSVVWSRCPFKTHNGGLDFPIVDSAALGPHAHELSHPTLRLRLRRFAHQCGASSSPSARAIHLVLQVLRDSATATAGVGASSPLQQQFSPEAPRRQEMCVTAQGVRPCAMGEMNAILA